MKKYILLIVVALFMTLGCDGPEDSGVVALDGPILESVDSNGLLEFNGAVMNIGENPVQSIYVVIVLKDENGNIIEASSTSLFGEGSTALLYPSEREFFSVLVESDPARVFSKDVEIYYEDLLE